MPHETCSVFLPCFRVFMMFDYIVSGIKNKVFMNTLPLSEKLNA